MLHNFKDYIRHGGNGEYLLARSGNGIVGQCVNYSKKYSFPNYDELRQVFVESLDELIHENTQFLLNTLTMPDTAPMVSEADLLELSEIKDAALVQWDERVERIYEEYHSHQQRLRPLRIGMEERLLRAFSGAINQIRQQDLGIERYIWRSRDDNKVRSTHAEYDDQTFLWDNPPSGGHPGQAHNCRCYAEPVLPEAVDNVMLTDFTIPADIPGSGLSRILGRRIGALTPLGAAALLALEASDTLQEFTRYMSEVRVRNATEMLGLDLDSAEGLLAAVAHELVYETVITGVGSNLPKNSDAARIAAQAAALYEMLHPGTILKVVGGDTTVQIELGDFIQAAYEAFEANRLQIVDGEFAHGWIEIFPEFNLLGTDILDLPGFTPAGIDALGGISAPHIVENNSAGENRELSEEVPETAPDGGSVAPAPEARGLPGTGEPGTWVVGPRGDRFYGPDGRPQKDIDWAHDHGQGRPHVHDWADGKRLPGRPATEEEKFSGGARGDDGQIHPEDWGK